MGAVAHEVRNLCGAMLVVQRNLARVGELENNQDFRTLTTLIHSLDRIAVMDRGDSGQNATTVELAPVLDELRILIEGTYRESGMEVEWHVPPAPPLVWADRHGLVQVFLNLAKNSHRAMQTSQVKSLCVSLSSEAKSVVIRFVDSGVGVSSPQDLFRAFSSGTGSTGLGLYVSRAIMRSFGGDLVYEPTAQGCCFLVVVPSLSAAEDRSHA
jgi:signal transduction histidine kinase